MPAWFEGGQTPLTMRLPKLRGFKRYYKLVERYQVVNLDQINEKFGEGETVSPETLKKSGLIKKLDLPVKILARGEGLAKKLVFEGIAKFSQKAKKLIEDAGGTIVAKEEAKAE